MRIHRGTTCVWPRREVELEQKLFVLGLRLTLASHGDLDVGDRLHAILRPLKEVTAAVAMALGETSIWEISSGAAQGGGWRIGNTPWERRSTGGGGTRNRHAARDTERCRER